MGPRTTADPAKPLGPLALEPGVRRLLPAILTPDAIETRADGRSGRPLPRTPRDWLVDVTCFGLAVMIGLLTFVGAYPSVSATDPWAWVDLTVGLVACLALWVRRRWPAGLVVALIPLGLFCTMASGAILIAMFTVAVHRPFRTVMAVAIPQAATAFVYLNIHPEHDVPYWVAVFLCAAIVAAVIAWGMFVRARRQLVLSLHDRALRAETEQQLRISQARETERARIAREMHDVLAHRISLLSMHAGALEFRPDARPEDVARAAGVIRASAHQALEDLRAVIGVLRTHDADDGSVAPVRPQPSLRDLPTLLAESRDAGMRIHERITVPDLTAVPDATARTAYHVVQEGLTNARKHAAGTIAELTVSGSPPGGLSVEIVTPPRVGTVVDPPIPGTGSGLIGLVERTVLTSGQLEHGPTPDGGFRLRAWLPWPT